MFSKLLNELWLTKPRGNIVHSLRELLKWLFVSLNSSSPPLKVRTAQMTCFAPPSPPILWVVFLSKVSLLLTFSWLFRQLLKALLSVWIAHYMAPFFHSCLLFTVSFHPVFSCTVKYSSFFSTSQTHQKILMSYLASCSHCVKICV